MAKTWVDRLIEWGRTRAAEPWEESTARSYKRELEQLARFKRKRLEDFTEDDLREYQTAHSGGNPKTWNRRVAAIRSLLQFRAAQGYRKDDPSMVLTRRPDRKPEPPTVDVPGEVRKLKSNTDQRIALFLYFSGCRLMSVGAPIVARGSREEGLSMRTKPLVNMREREALRILRKVFSGTPYEAYTKVGMTEVMEPSPGEELSYEDRNYYMTSRFDYVVCRGDLVKPVFALEFDGPRHESAMQQERDIRKNRLCDGAGLPLLRVGPVELHPHERVSLLEFMLRRFVAWPAEEERHLADINERLNDASPAEHEELFEGGVLDPSIDPTFIFDIEHPFPGIAEVRKRLSRRFGLQDACRVDRIMDRGERAYWAWAWDRGAVGGYKAVSRCDFAVFEPDGAGQFGWHHESGVLGAARVFMSDRLEFSMHHLLPIVHDFDPYTDTWFDYHARTGKGPYAFGELPGVFIPRITTTFALYLGLREVEKWSRRALQEVR